MVLKSTLPAAIWVLAFTICSSVATATNNGGEPSVVDFEGFEALVGGPRGILELHKNSTAEVFRTVVESFGMKYMEHNSASLLQLSGCPQYFATTYRSAWHAYDGELFYIDSSGRPSQAYKSFPPVAAASRRRSCQSSVGQWGDAEDPSNNYDGGHIIGAQLGGWGGRLNLVPWDNQFNGGNWALIENQVAACRELPSSQNERVFYHVRVFYSNSNVLVPYGFRLLIEDTGSCSGSNSLTMDFDNVDWGGSSGTSKRTTAQNWLRDIGCGAGETPASYCG